MTIRTSDKETISAQLQDLVQHQMSHIKVLVRNETKVRTLLTYVPGMTPFALCFDGENPASAGMVRMHNIESVWIEEQP